MHVVFAIWPLGEPRRARGDALPGRRRSHGFVHFVRSGKLPSGSFLSAFIGGQYGVFAFALDREKKHIWPPCDPAAQVALPESPLLCRAPKGRLTIGLQVANLPHKKLTINRRVRWGWRLRSE